MTVFSDNAEWSSVAACADDDDGEGAVVRYRWGREVGPAWQ